MSGLVKLNVTWEQMLEDDNVDDRGCSVECNLTHISLHKSVIDILQGFGLEVSDESEERVILNVAGLGTGFSRYSIPNRFIAQKNMQRRT